MINVIGLCFMNPVTFPRTDMKNMAITFSLVVPRQYKETLVTLLTCKSHWVMIHPCKSHWVTSQSCKSDWVTRHPLTLKFRTKLIRHELYIFLLIVIFFLLNYYTIVNTNTLNCYIFQTG
ncbi:hypothetical protein Hanom_Chr11g01028401 [Helianthus anomalus]